MSFNQFDTPAVLANIRVIDNAYPGSMKKAALVAAMAELNIGQQPTYFDPFPTKPYVQYTDEALPGSMKEAALVYFLAQANYGPHILDAGVQTLSGAATTVLSASADANNIILLTYYYTTGDTGSIYYSNVVDGVSFVIHSTNSSDTNKVSWTILQG